MSQDSRIRACYQTVPESLLTARRDELSDLTLNLLDPDLPLPLDLYGHLFIVSTVGSVDSGGLPYTDGTPLFNGDGMVYRLDFNQPGQVTVKTRLAQTPCFYADRATQTGTPDASRGFQNHGISRFSSSLGFRNQPNTAFVPLRFSGDERDRLLVTSDAGRPYELDTETLELVTPIGSNREWQPEGTKLSPFLSVLTTAHPYFDAAKKEFLTVNYGRSIANFFAMIPIVQAAKQLLQTLVSGLEAIAGWVHLQGVVRWIIQLISKLVGKLLDGFFSLLSKLSGLSPEDFVYLMRWDGQGDLERWRLVLPDGSPVAISQGLHQIGVTRHYVVLIETAFIVGFAEVLSNPLPKIKLIEQLFRRFLAKPPASTSRVYLVRRADLVNGQHPARSEPEVKITVCPTEFPMEVLHFATDYDDADGRITLHVGHWCAGDAAEWVRRFDRCADGKTPIDPRLIGMHIRGTDIGRLSRYTIQSETGQVLESKTVLNDPATWGVALYTFRNDLPIQQPNDRIASVYWYSEGVFPELLTQFDLELFQDYRYRFVAIADLLKQTQSGQGRPACLLRLDTATMTLADVYNFACGSESGGASYVANSPQFVPRAGGSSDPTDGYIICTVFVTTRSEIWIFDARHLHQGPVCKLGHPDLVFGSTLHTAWLPTMGQRTAAYDVPVQADYESLVEEKSKDWPGIQTFFENEVYPHFK